MQVLTQLPLGLAEDLDFCDMLWKRYADSAAKAGRDQEYEDIAAWGGFLMLTSDKKKAQDAYKEFTDARQKLMASMLPAGMRARFAGATGAGGAPATGAAADGGAPPAAPTTPTVTLTPEEQQAAQKKALRDFEKGRLAMGTKLVAAVTPTAASNWKVLIGAPFTFRDDE